MLAEVLGSSLLGWAALCLGTVTIPLGICFLEQSRGKQLLVGAGQSLVCPCDSGGGAPARGSGAMDLLASPWSLSGEEWEAQLARVNAKAK